MDIEEAIRRAEQWRKDGACGPAAVVAIALLNELERARPHAGNPDTFGDDTQSSLAAALKWWRSAADPLAEAQSKANDDMLAAQRNLLLREDGYPNAPTE